MRRYVRPEPKLSKQLSASEIKALPANFQPRKRISSKRVTADDMSSIPASFLGDAKLIQPKKSKLPKRTPIHKLRHILDRENDDVDPTLHTTRAIGSKILNHRRMKKQPLMTIDDRLARTNVIERDECDFTYKGNTFHVIELVCQKDKVKDASPHLIDYNEPEEEPETTCIYLVTLVGPTDSEYLLESPVGRVCPYCRTSEYIKSDLKDMPISFQDANWRNKDKFGEHCEVCNCVSK